MLADDRQKIGVKGTRSENRRVHHQLDNDNKPDVSEGGLRRERTKVQ